MNATQSKGYRSSIVWICWPRQVTKQQSSLFITKVASKSLCMWCKHINTHACTHSVCVCENTCLIHVNSMPAQKAKKKKLSGNTDAKLTILAVKTSFPRRAKRPRPSEEALRCAGQMSPSNRMLCQIKS